MEFIQQNYLWFILGFVFVVMIIIGYIAEKTDFGHKKTESKEKPSDKKEEIRNLEQIKLSDVVYKEETPAPAIKAELIEEKAVESDNVIENTVETPEELTDATLAELSVPLEETLKEEKTIKTGNEIKEEKIEEPKEAPEENQEQLEEAKLEENKAVEENITKTEALDKEDKQEDIKENKKDDKVEEIKENKKEDKVEEIKEEKQNTDQTSDDVWTSGTIKETMPEEVEEEKEDIWNF